VDEKEVKVAVYTRVSTEDQAKEGFSLDAQLERLRSYCSARGWTIACEYVDEGHSGRTTKRPAYQRMMDERGLWDTVLVLKMDRIHRNSKNFMIMMEHLGRDGKEFASMTESLDTSTAMGRFVMDIIQRIAQLESEQIGERVYIGMQQKAKTTGGVLGFNIPYGYTYANGRLWTDEVEGKVVRRIFRDYLAGQSMGRIAGALQTDGVATKQEKNWGPKTISNILKNPVYCGYLRWEDYLNQGDHEPLINADMFNKVQLEIMGRIKRGRTDYRPLLLDPGA